MYRKTHAIPLLGYVPLSLKKKNWKNLVGKSESTHWIHKCIKPSFLFDSHLCIRIHSDFCFEIVVCTLLSLFIDDARCGRAFLIFFLVFWYDFTCFLVRIFYKELTLLQCNITRHGLIQLDNQNCILVVIEREGKWMMMILQTRWTFEQVSWRSVWCCLKSKVTQSSVINCLHSFFGFYVLHAWFLWWSKSK